MIVAVVGASGCGKSTLLRMVAGLEQPSIGTVHLNGRRVAGPSRDVGLVFQEPRLMPWLSVRDNIAFGLHHLRHQERRELAEAAIERVHLAGFADALPKELSGGMAQRTALARALVARPPLLLLDEPFSALDALTRQALQDELLTLWAQDRPTMLLVTHDLDEALALADRVVCASGRARAVLGAAGGVAATAAADSSGVPAPQGRIARRAAGGVAGGGLRRNGSDGRDRAAGAAGAAQGALQGDPETAVITLRAEGELADGLACKVDTGRALVEAGLHLATGGSGLQACSGDMLLEALAACAGYAQRRLDRPRHPGPFRQGEGRGRPRLPRHPWRGQGRACRLSRDPARLRARHGRRRRAARLAHQAHRALPRGPADAPHPACNLRLYQAGGLEPARHAAPCCAHISQ